MAVIIGDLASATDLGAAVIARAIETLADAVGREFDSIVKAAPSDHPLQGETLGGIAAALGDIAAAIRNRASRRAAAPPADE
jgi:hypothetical protein